MALLAPALVGDSRVSAAFIVPVPEASVGAGQTLLLATVATMVSASTVTVTVDGASSSVLGIVPQQLQPMLVDGAAVGARVMGCRVGGRFYITDVISGGNQTQTLLARDFRSGSSNNLTLTNNVSGQLVVAVNLTPVASGGTIPANARMAYIRSHVHAYAAGLQQVTNYLTYRFNATGAFQTIEQSSEHNNGTATKDIGSTLSGWFNIPQGTISTINIQMTMDVANGGFNVVTSMSGFSVDFFR